MSEVGHDPVLEVAGLRVETEDGADIVDGISFSVRPGVVLGLVGESGCGKTTTALALLGQARPGTTIAAGLVRLGGVELLELSRPALRRVRGAQIAYVPQDPSSSLNPRHRVGAQIAETLIVHGTPAAEARATARALADRVRLPSDDGFLRRYPFELSGGQQQRVTIAMALAAKPMAVVLDEPTTGLDVTTQARVLGLIRELAQDTGAAFVYVTHDLAVVDGLADHVAVMYAGRIVESGPQDRVFRRPAHPYTALLLASVPRLAVRHGLVGIPGTAPPPGDRPAGCFFAARCPLADEQSLAEFPPSIEIEPDHFVRCWHASELIAQAPEHRPEPEAPRREEALLAVDGVVASYGRGATRNVVLHGISLALGEGECLALVGESGSGKTTLGRCVAGLHSPDAGGIALRGRELAPTAARRTQEERRAVQIVFQNPDRSLNPSETVADGIARPLRLFGLVERRSERAAVLELMERVRLPRRAIDRYPRELSGGEKQRVAIARALAARPSLIVCDEITSALDVSIQAAIVSLVEELRLGGLALLFITHNLALVNSIADRVLVLEAGDVREEGGIVDVIEHPTDAYTKELLAAAPELRAPDPV